MVEKVAEPIVIKSWDDWFDNCGRVLKSVREYEDLVKQYYDSRCDDGREADQLYAERHNMSFWESDAKFTPKIIKHGLITGLVGLLFGAILGIAVGFLMESHINPVICVLLGILGLACGAAVGLLPSYLKEQSITKKMKALEDELSIMLRFIPPKYRNSFCIDAFYDLYCSYGIMSFDKAIETVDVHIENNAQVYVPICILFDLTYSSSVTPTGTFVSETLSDSDFEGGESSTDDIPEPDMSNLAMPSDIKSHVSHGVSNYQAELDKLVGMKGVKDQIRKMKNRIEFYGSAQSAGNGSEHLVFLGSAGTGKTEVARIITGMLYDFGYIKKNQIVEVDGEYLKSQYIGQTGARVDAIVQYALGGVLFIDEAYLLYDEKDTSSVGKEAIGVLLKAMEDKRDQLVVILAGYEDGINRLISSNEGFSSRIKHKLYFSDYSAEELGEIFKVFLKHGSQNVHDIQDTAYETLVDYFDFERRMPGFGNARAARNALDALLDIHADRYVEGSVNEADKFIIISSDMDVFLEKEHDRIAADGRNFLATRHVDERIITQAELKARVHAGADDSQHALDKLVGLDDVKEQIAAFKRRSDFYNAAAVDEVDINLNAIIAGPVGSGKTSIVDVLCASLYESGYIRENAHLDVTGDFLKASYVGQTGKRTEAIIEYSKGMMLVIDKAGLLAGQGSDFGSEAMGVLIDALSKSSGEICVIFIDSESGIEALLNAYPTLSSYIGTRFDFEAYSLKDLCRIALRVANIKGFKVDKVIWKEVLVYMKQDIEQVERDGAWYASRLVSDLISAHIANFADGMYSEDQRMIITLEDLHRVKAA